MTFEEIIDKLLDNGIEITLKKQDGVVWYDLNTGMKSHLWITKDEDYADGPFAKYQARYDESGTIRGWSDLMWVAKQCKYGYDFINTSWCELLVKEGMLQVITKTTVSYE